MIRAVVSLASLPLAEKAERTTRVLVVDDEPHMLSMMRRVLEADGYGVILAGDGRAALEILRSESIDLMILDVMMPDLDGFDVCRAARRESLIPILMLTARDAGADKVSGLDCGADDYVVKPFENDELMARVRAVLRRAQPRQVELLRFQDVELVPSEREARRGDEALELTAREYDLLELFLRYPRQVLTREQILQAVWGFDYLGDSNLVDVRIKYLRDKLESGGRTRLIQTVRGAGYALRS
ncbi:MAG: response regulator transcription factor [Chloroflexi bacterium]|nr:response regulator transcription factor [Chloroflexota bacterium]MBV9599380.1 response regulator transcription factor [Chloroflexota bacterium]